MAVATVCLGRWPLDAQDPPQFRTGVELVRVETVVLDSRTRKPIRGLTAADFVITVNGERQDIVSLSQIDLPSRTQWAAASQSRTPADVATNTVAPSRLFVIVMDDAKVPFNAFTRVMGKKIANRVIDELGPNDLAAVVFVRNNANAQEFTGDTALLRRAVDSYVPGRGIGPDPFVYPTNERLSQQTSRYSGSHRFCEQRRLQV